MPHIRRAGVVLLAALTLAGSRGAGRAESLDPEELATLRELVEAVQVAHDRYGAEVSYRDLFYAHLQAMLRDLDPHTSFLSERAFEGMRSRQQASFYGIGILVSMRDGRLTVISPLEGTPAARLGLRPGDVIAGIDGEPTESMSLDEAVDRIKGPKGTEVRVTIVRRGLDRPFDLTIRRAEIPQDTVRYAYMMTPDTGYLRLTDFSRSSAGEMEEALAKLRGLGMRRLLLDLRNNGGGLLDQAIAVADLFLPAGSLIVETRGRLPGSTLEYRDDAGDPDPELALPLVVLVNAGTASAAEILAGALQDHDVALIVGTSTWGKGLVQTVYTLSYGTAIALTTSRYHTPSGRVIQRDYSSYYDYLARLEPDRERDGAGAASGKFSTALGRPVRGGGGITPDVVVEAGGLDVFSQYLLSRNAFLEFAIDRQRRRPVESESWMPDEETLSEFAVWLQAQGIATEEEIRDRLPGDRETRAFCARMIRSELFNLAFGQEAAHRALAAGDVQIQAAIGLFEDAADLLRRRSEPGVAADAAAPVGDGGSR